MINNNELEVRKMEESNMQIGLNKLELHQFCFPTETQFQSNKFFECVASTLEWPKNVWPLLFQCVFMMVMHPYLLS